MTSNRDNAHQGTPALRLITVIVLALLEFILIAALIPSRWSERQREIEVRWLIDAMGPVAAAHITHDAQAWYGAWFLRTGIVDATYDLFLPDDEDSRRSPELHRMENLPLWQWLDNRLDVIWFAVYTAIQRLVILAAWWPFLLLALAGAIGDGLLRRKIRQSGFAYPSPIAHRYALRAIKLLLLLTLFGLLLPVPLPAAGVPLLTLAFTLGVGVWLTNTQKRI